MTIILIAGGTGLIGSHLSGMLASEGYLVRHLSRKPNPSAAFPTYSWDPDTGKVDPAALEGVSYVINLAGAGIADKPWTKARRETIISSRVNGTNALREAILKMQKKPLGYIAASAIGFYGDSGENWLDEHSPSGSGFLSESCMEWETAINGVATTGVRTVVLRIGIVLSAKGGALEKLAMPLRLHLAPYLGNGLQWYSWIHIEDVCRLFLFALQQETLEGVFNAVAPTPVRHRTLIQELVGACQTKAFRFPVPALFLRMGMGEMADVVLDSTRVSARKILMAGFNFRFPGIGPALTNLMDKQE
jgi:uncharacterized protein (TIGR01777 family)